MLVTLAWFTERGPLIDDAALGVDARLERYLIGRSGPGWHRVSAGGPGWGIRVATAGSGRWNWSQADRDESLTAVGIGLPVGVAPAALRDGLLGLARTSWDERREIRHVVPPFGLLAADERRGEFRVHQDWMGMARLYVYRTQGVVAFANRPLVLPYAFGDELCADPEGWAHFVGGDAFCGRTTPVRGVRQISAGVTVSGRRQADGRWAVTMRADPQVDDLVAEAAGAPAAADLDVTAEGIRRSSESLRMLWPGPIPFGLSGGKDSRLVAAAFLDAGVIPHFSTRKSTTAEAETATMLLELARAARGIDIPHTVTAPFTPAAIAAHPLRERADQLLRRYDCEFPAAYVLRPPVGQTWLADLPAPTVGGAAGEIATGKWIPGAWLHDDVGPSEVVTALRTAVGKRPGRPWSTPRLDRHVDVLAHDLRERGERLGLRGSQVLHWAYLVTRMRRWSSASHLVYQVTPLLTPEFIRAGFGMCLADKRAALTHRRLTERLMPEWSGIPWVGNAAGLRPAQIPRVWDGDGADVLDQLLAEPADDLTDLVDRAQVRASLARARTGSGSASDDGVLQVFTVLGCGAALLRELSLESRAAQVRPVVEVVPPRPRLVRRIARALPEPVKHVLRPVRDAARSRRRSRGQAGPSSSS
ncbi:MAG TPA: hypothetical protein VIP77_00010 [Jiangellaceae bacterium]